LIRRAQENDHAAIWRVLEPIIRGGEAYALPRDMDQAAAIAFWAAPGSEVFVAEADGKVVGTSFIRANQQGGGSHVANCGYATATEATGRGIAREMCRHSLDYARERGFRAMQFNFVISTNERAVKLWGGLGFDTVGRLPQAFRHPRLGYVDVLVMYRSL
jgi:L-amino acid N-acyltransferase YncA